LEVVVTKMTEVGRTSRWDDLSTLPFKESYPLPRLRRGCMTNCSVGMRLYAPTQAFFDKQWKPDDIVKVK
jgi:hypothetical protein